jgi:hypothetical protein
MASRIVLTLILGISMTAYARAQTTRQAYPVEMALPFGVSAGKLVPNNEYLIFIDDQEPEASFVISRSNVQSIEEQGGLLSIQVHQAVRDRSGERTRLSFRTQTSGVGSALNAWSRMASPAMSGSSGAERQAQGMSYQAEHNHRLGGCNGQLMITDDRIIFESITDLDHSRQWAMKDVRELRRHSPYRLEIKPFTGGDYTIRLLGNGMDNEDYNRLVRSITAARAGQ